ncbi:MAG: amidohydrolase family protein [Verrucomicrobiota bacterium]
MKIDSHHHFWKYSPEEYGWIDGSMKGIRRDFLPCDLEKEMQVVGVDGVISVQARTTLEETRWLLDLADQTDWIQGIVGWVPLVDPRVESVLEEFSQNRFLKSVRHILQAEPDEFFTRSDFNRGLTYLKKAGLAYDLLIQEKQLPVSIELVDRHPDQVIILDHIAKPKIKEGEIEIWRRNIRELAKRSNVHCKISGMVTEADFENWTMESLEPYFETVLEAFGAERLLFGSDWPVCLVACGYRQWMEVVSHFMKKLSIDEQAKIWGQNAIGIYHLNLTPGKR